jgi:hypothetical protein
MRLVHWLVVMSLFTASFDSILTVNVGGTLRLCQVMMIGVCVAALAKIVQEGRVLWPRGSTALAVWMGFQALFLPMSGVVSIGIEFFVLLLFTVVSVLAVVQIYGRSAMIEALMKMYLLSYVFVAAFGLIQFALPLAGLPSPLVIQWIVHGRLARINAFSYEPSYFATYMIMGWIILVELRISKAEITAGRGWKWATYLVTAALFLSTSKTAWVFMLLEGVARGVPILWRRMNIKMTELSYGRLLVRVPTQGTVLKVAMACALLVVGAKAVTRIVANPTIFLSGTGLGNTPAHSYNDRSAAANTTIAAFLEHPLLGRSLGGVPIYIASRGGVTVTNMEEVRHFWGFPVLLDVLVASGVFGFIPVLMFIYANTLGAMRVAKRYWGEERAKWVRALGRAMIFEWMLLMTDQNLLRVYVWFHISMVAVVAYHLEFAAAPQRVAVENALRVSEMGEATATV